MRMTISCRYCIAFEVMLLFLVGLIICQYKNMTCIYILAMPNTSADNAHTHTLNSFTYTVTQKLVTTMQTQRQEDLQWNGCHNIWPSPPCGWASLSLCPEQSTNQKFCGPIWPIIMTIQPHNGQGMVVTHMMENIYSKCKVPTRLYPGVTDSNEKKRSERRKHYALAVARRSQIFLPRRRPLPGGAGQPKFNQLEMVTTFTYKPSLVRIDACNFELSW